MEVEGRYKLHVVDPQGREIQREGKNLIVSAGRLALANLMMSLANYSPPSHIAFGSGTNVPLITNTALQSEQHAFDIIAGGDVRTATLGSDLREFLLSMAVTTQETYVGATFTLNEVGIFGRVATKTAVMFSRFLVQTFDLTTGSKFTFSWALSFKDKA